MYISKVSLVNYRNFENSYFLFNKGINTIIGENASGKTNLFRAIRLILDDNLLSYAYKLNENDFNRNLINWKGRWIIISLEFSEISNEEAIQALFVYGSGVIADDKVKKATYNLFFRPKPEIRKQLSIAEIDSDLMQLYEAYLHGKGAVRNTSSFYMRILRAVYNRALEKGLMEQHNPFRHVYTGVDKTVKRAVPLSAIKRMKNLDLSLQPNLEFARDMFLFSFYTRGMSFIDMAHLKKKDLQNGFLSYRRRKTGQQLVIRWEKCMQEIVGKYPEDSFSPYLLPVLKYPFKDTHKHYRNVMSGINRNLKEIARLADISVPLSMYCARHSWASAAKGKNIPISVISEGMGHDSEATTQIYLASLDNSVVDKANFSILREL